MNVPSLVRCVIAALVALPLAVHAQQPEAIMVQGETMVATIHAQGAQVYECKADASGALVWQFREPVATLLSNGKTLGRHYAGPTWELADGSAVVAKVAASAPGASPTDIPLLKLAVVSHKGSGLLAGVDSIQRLNTKGGVAKGPCDAAGAFLSVPYSADYAFYKKS
jgi:hypothetical protein